MQINSWPYTYLSNLEVYLFDVRLAAFQKLEGNDLASKTTYMSSREVLYSSASLSSGSEGFVLKGTVAQ